MTTAPQNLLAVRRELLEHLGPYGLQPLEVGIVGDPSHIGGYHVGKAQVRRNTSGTITDYSVTESLRDRAGLSDYASALDVGTFSYQGHNLRTFSVWCVQQCEAKAADTRDIREIIYSPDGSTVKRWDRLGIRSTGDDSHEIHTHFSFFRDSSEANRAQPLFRRYLATIGLIEETDMTPEEHGWLQAVHRNLTILDGRNPIGQIYTRATSGTDDKLKSDGLVYKPTHATLNGLDAKLAAVQASLAALAGKDWVDEEQVVTGVLNGLGLKPEPEIAQALAAAGVDPVALAEALLALPPQPA